jgi:putative endopeptidase
MTDLKKQDFYEYVNGDWIKTAVIPADKPATGGFQDLVEGIDQRLINELNQMSQNELAIPENRMQDAVKFYQLARDYDTRNQLADEPIADLLKRIAALSSFEELNHQLSNWIKEGLPLPFYFFVMPDMKNATEHALYLNPTSLILPDKTYYEDGHPKAEKLLQVFFEMSVKLLQKFGRTLPEAETIAEQALAFDKAIAPHVLSAEESADYTKAYNPKKLTEVATYSEQLDFVKVIGELVAVPLEQVIVTEPAYFEALDEIMNEENLPLLKSWMYIQTILAYTSYLSEDLRQLGGTYRRFLSGIDAAMSQEKAAYHLTLGEFGQVIGLYYGQKYFGDQAKQDVQHMVHTMIDVYKERLSTKEWLSPATREKAIVKLNNIGVHVGYPDRIPAVYDLFITQTAEEGGTLVSNVRYFSRLAREARFAKIKQAVDRNEWSMAACTVNAYYSGMMNVIVFPAAILQQPFYSVEQSASANYGGIGAVIAHEISHAFDNNGAKFDELGNLNNWWSEEDLAHFNQLAEAMIAEFDGLEIAGGKVNGKLTVSENIADAGGLSCALEAAKKEADVSLDDFFTNWAKIWRTKAKEQYQQLLLSVDVHGPAKLRANIQLQNLADFHEFYGIETEDAMYRAPENRVEIW